MLVQTDQLRPGMQVQITQQIPFGTGTTTTSMQGTILRVGQQKTGSWFAHAEGDKLWLDRVEIRKADGEIAAINLDQYSRVEEVR